MLNRFSRAQHFGSWECLTALLAVAVTVFVGCETAGTGDVAEAGIATTQTGTLTVVIDFNGRQPKKTFDIPTSDDSTVLSVLNRAREDGELEFLASGNRQTAFISAIDGVENEKANGDNWTFRVNGELGDRSCGIFPAKSGDQILWRFGAYP